jgi:PASTA domain-containing protein
MRSLSAFLPRLVALTVAWLLATTALTYAAAKRMVTPTVKSNDTPIAPQARQIVVVPDVRRQPYVFAKGILGDAGFAWKVTGAVKGFSSNLVASQSPLPGTRLVDTGAPTISLTLRTDGRQVGTPEAASAFAGTAVQLVDLPKRVIPRSVLSAPKPKAAAPKVAAKPKAPAVAKATPAVKKSAPVAKWPQSRPAAFTVAGAKPEPLDEMPLPNRAQALLQWVDGKPEATDANVTHWLYQHQWIVTGARLGWWRGAEALKTLVEVDRRVWQQWGIGARSADLARQTLAEVEASAR